MLKVIDAPVCATDPVRFVTIDEVVDSLRDAVAAAGSQRAFCQTHGLFESELSNVLHGRRPPNRAMMRAVGVDRALIQWGLPL